MRLNRLAQIGLIVIVAAVLLWVGLKIFGSKQTEVAQNNANDTNVVPVSANADKVCHAVETATKPALIFPLIPF